MIHASRKIKHVLDGVGIGRYFDSDNFERPHQSLGHQTPDAFYRGLIHNAARAFHSGHGLTGKLPVSPLDPPQIAT